MNQEISCVTSEGENIYLNTFMTSSEFARAKFSNKVKEPGVLAKKIEGIWNFQNWSFEETFENQDGNVILKGNAFSGKTLKTYFENLPAATEDSSAKIVPLAQTKFSAPEKFSLAQKSSELSLEEKAKSVKAAATVVNVIEEAINLKQELPELGGGAIFISDDFSQIIFLPKLFFMSSILCCKENIFMQEHGFYVNENLTKFPALKFIQATIAYKTLSQNFPFENPDRAQRALDILDRNFILPQIKIPGLNENVANAIFLGLSQNPEEEKSQSKKKSNLPKNLQETKKTATNTENFLALHFPRTEFFEEAGLSSQGEIPESKKLNFIDRSSKINQKEFLKFSKRSNKKQAARVESKRWIRKHRTILIASLIILFTGIFIGTSFVISSQEKPTSQGLTSFQTVEMFYSAMNTLDVDQSLACTYGKEMKNFTDILSNLYVSFKASAMYNLNLQAQPLTKWLCINQSISNLAGLSQVKIDSKQSKLFFKAPQKKQHPKIITQENENLISDGDKIFYDVNFYAILTEEHNEITVQSLADKVELTYKKNRWLITAIERKTLHEEKISKQDFINDYESAVEETGKDINSILQILSLKYFWMPTNAELQEAIYWLSAQKILTRWQ